MAVERRKTFEPGEMIATFLKEYGVVISEEVFATVRNNFKEKKRAGRYFAPGCCLHPDYVIQIPVLFEDGTYDVMRAMNIKKALDLPQEKGAAIRKMIKDRYGESSG